MCAYVFFCATVARSPLELALALPRDQAARYVGRHVPEVRTRSGRALHRADRPSRDESTCWLSRRRVAPRRATKSATAAATSASGALHAPTAVLFSRLRC